MQIDPYSIMLSQDGGAVGMEQWGKGWRLLHVAWRKDIRPALHGAGWVGGEGPGSRTISRDGSLVII